MDSNQQLININEPEIQEPEALDTTAGNKDIFVIERTRSGSECVAAAHKLIREATDALVPWYKIVDAHRPMRTDAAEGVLWGLTLLVERLETFLGDLQDAVAEDAMTAEVAAARAHERVLHDIQELRFGCRLRPRHFGRRAPLPSIAELGRLCSIVERLADGLADLSESCGGGGRRVQSTIRLHVHSDQ